MNRKITLTMTCPQYDKICELINSTKEYALLGQARIKDRKIEVVLLTIKHFNQCNKLFKKIGLITK